MNIRFLGTGAADRPIKEVLTRCDFRRNSSLLIDGILLIDPGPEVPDAFAEWKIDPTEIRFILNTHRHGDHFCQATLDMLTAHGARFLELTAGETIEIDRYTIQAVAGNHPVPTCHFLISDGERRLFYGTDGAWLMYDEVQAIQAAPVDLAILDATVGFLDGDYRIFEHNNLNMILEMKKTLSAYVQSFCITHMAHTLHTDHATLAEAMKPYGILTAYDGMELLL